MGNVELKTVVPYSGSLDEGRNSPSTTSKVMLSSGTIKYIDIFFNDTPYGKYSSSHQFESSGPVAGDTRKLSPGGEFEIANSRCEWIFSLSGNTITVSFGGAGLAGYTAYWNTACTIYYSK